MEQLENNPAMEELNNEELVNDLYVEAVELPEDYSIYDDINDLVSFEEQMQELLDECQEFIDCI